MTGFKQLKGLVFFLWDFFRLLFTLVFTQVDVVHINPSLDKKSIIRDGTYVLLVKIFNKRVVVHFRGWVLAAQEWVEGSGKSFFRWIFKKADVTIVLGTSFKNHLVGWGWDPSKIIVSSTMFDEDSIVPAQAGKKSAAHILFLAIFLKEKGVLELLKSFQTLSTDYPDIRLTLAGDGPLFSEIKRLVDEWKLSSRVSLPGFLHEGEKYQLLATGDIFVLPTMDYDGCPNALLEAMGSGLALVSRPVGGIPDVIKEGRNGFLMTGTSVEELTAILKRFLDDPVLLDGIKINNKTDGFERFRSRKVVCDIQNIYDGLLTEKM